MNDMSPWTKWGFVAVVVAAVGSGYWFSLGPGAASVASWRPDGTVNGQSLQLPVLVNEDECASGASATGRIQQPDIQYRRDAVVITIRVAVRSGSEDCQGNPDTPYVVQLEEPIGTRELLDGGTRPPALPQEG